MDKALLQVIILTLCDIEVRGKDNMSKLLGCINALENFMGAEEPKDGEEVNNG